jgi:hypothetical protein
LDITAGEELEVESLEVEELSEEFLTGTKG